MNAPQIQAARYFSTCSVARVIRNSLVTIVVTCLTACAGTEPNYRTSEPSAAEVAKAIGCSSDEVAVCIEVNCELEDWQCSPRDDVRQMFKVDEFKH